MTAHNNCGDDTPMYGDKIAELHHSGSASGVVADPPSPTPASSIAAILNMPLSSLFYTSNPFKRSFSSSNVLNCVTSLGRIAPYRPCPVDSSDAESLNVVSLQDAEYSPPMAGRLDIAFAPSAPAQSLRAISLKQDKRLKKAQLGLLVTPIYRTEFDFLFLAF